MVSDCTSPVQKVDIPYLEQLRMKVVHFPSVSSMPQCSATCVHACTYVCKYVCNIAMMSFHKLLSLITS